MLPEPVRTPLLPLDGFNQLYPSRYGYCLVNQYDTVVGRSIATYGEYFESEVAIFRQACHPGDRVVDVGANIGTHTLALARIVGPGGFVCALEPQRVLFQVLCANAALNGLAHVECIHAAAGAEAGFLHLPEVDYGQPTNFGGVEATPLGQGRRVRKVRLDEVLESGRVHFLKIDVEGMERDVLLGGQELLRVHRPILYVENDRLDRSKPLLETLLEFGYRPYWHFPAFFNPDNFFQNPVNIHYHGLIDQVDHYAINGFAINLLCLPREARTNIVGMAEVRDPDEHPLKKDCPLLAGLPIIAPPGPPVQP